MITTESGAKLSRNEGLKQGNPLLTGTLPQALVDASTDHFSEDDYEFLKFHGVYQQDDRDRRKTGKHYMMMVRTRFPGGTLSAAQYKACDELSDRYGNQTMRITTRQDFQFHGILKANLRQTIKSLNDALMTTIAACGDVARNVMASPIPATSPLVDYVLAEAKKLSSLLAPKTPGYAAIWLEGQEIDFSQETKDAYVDPLYGKTYLPRKFKTAFAFPPVNDVDIFTNDLGFVVIAEGDRLLGYNLLAGGGLGMSHGNAATFPRLADVVGFIRPDQLEAAAKAVVGIHRDFGDRTNRKHARLKYVIAERGVDWFRAELETRLGAKLESARPFQFTQQRDMLGWHRQTNGNYFLGLFVQSGRVKDVEGYRLKTGLRRAIDQFQPEVRLTANQNILLADVRPEQQAGIDQVLAEHGISTSNPYSQTQLASMACPSMPTCGLGLAESERALPGFLTQIDALLEELGLKNEELIVRMTGCPNGCARPSMAEIAFVGKAPNKYQIYLGGNEGGTRLNRLFKESVKGDEIINELRPLLARYRDGRQPGERFGDYCHRVILAEQPAATA